MPLILNGTTGISGVDGSAGTPSYQGTDTNTGIFYPAADTIAFAEGGAEIARFDSSGNLGIGTSSPITKLNISGSSLASGELGTLAVTGNTTAKRLAVGVDSSSTMYSWMQSVENGVAFRDLSLQPLGGNVGIGTSSPSAKLDVDAGNPTVINAGGVTVTGQSSGIRFRTGSTKIAWYVGAQNNIDQAFEITPSTANGGTTFSTPAFVINSSGNVGIGMTPSGDSRLEVYSADSATIYKNVNTGTGTSDGFYVGMGKGSLTEAYVYNRENNNIIFGTNNTERMRINSNGDLIINATSGNAACKLNVNGNIFQAPSYSGNFTGGWQNVVNIDSTFGGSSGRIRVHANENGNNNVSYGEWFFVSSAAGPQLSAQGQVTSGNAFGTAQLRMSGATLQIQNALGGAIGSWKVTFELFVG